MPYNQGTTLVRVNFRSQPNTDNTPIRLLHANEEFTVLYVVNPDWLCININGEKGYISAKTRYISYSFTPWWELKANDILSLGNQYLGTPYVWGAREGDTHHFDCSSFMWYICHTNGIDLPRNSYQQELATPNVSKSELRAGDLMFFVNYLSNTTHANHVGMFVGDGRILHTYKAPFGVTYSDFTNYWDRHFLVGGRVIEDVPFGI